MKKSNSPFIYAKIGVESGSDKILNEVCNRKTKIKTIINSFDLLHKNSIKTSACFMVGFPYETREDIFKSINLCNRIKPDEVIVNIFQPMPGQRLTDLCIKEGFLTGKEKLTNFTSRSILRMPQISPEEILNLRRVFLLYAMLPKKYYEKIEKCEKDYDNNKSLYEELVSLRWRLNK